MRTFIKSFCIIIFCVLTFTSSRASPQFPDYLIIGKDTLPIYFLPLNHLDTTTQRTFFRNLESDSLGLRVSFNLWRGYQAYWQLIDKRLYLVGLKHNPHSDQLLKTTFKGRYQNGRVFADWFSSYLAIGKDKMLKWDGVFSRTYFKEEIYDFKNGCLMDVKMVDSYIPVKNGISRLDSNRKHITDTIFRLVNGLNWKKLSECNCDDKYSISINDKGKVGNIELVYYTKNTDTIQMEINDHKKCIEKFKRKLKNLQFDIVRWHGQPYDEKYYVKFFYTVEGVLENWTN
jgi:hypothetical protein